MSYLAITIDVESDFAAFAGKLKGLLGVTEGLPKYMDFLINRGYHFSVFITCARAKRQRN